LRECQKLKLLRVVEEYMGSVVENAASFVASKSCIEFEAAVNSGIASSNVHPS